MQIRLKPVNHESPSCGSRSRWILTSTLVPRGWRVAREHASYRHHGGEWNQDVAAPYDEPAREQLQVGVMTVWDTRRMTDINLPVFNLSLRHLSFKRSQTEVLAASTCEEWIAIISIYSSNLLCLSLAYTHNSVSLCLCLNYKRLVSTRDFWSPDFLITAGPTIECYCSAIWYTRIAFCWQRESTSREDGAWKMKGCESNSARCQLSHLFNQFS